MPVGAVASLGGAVIGAIGANRAASQQASAARNGIEAQERMANDARAETRANNALAVNALKSGVAGSERALWRGFTGAANAVKSGRQRSLNELDRGYRRTSGFLNPLIESGDRARNALEFNLGLGDAPAGYGGFEETPYQKYIMGRTMDAIDGSAAARGGLFSSATLDRQQENASGLAGQFFGDYLGRLGGVAGQGAAARGQMGQYATQLGSNKANVISSAASQLSGIRQNRGSAIAGLRSGTAGGIAGIYSGQGNALSGISLGLGDAMANGYGNIGNAQSAGSIGVANSINAGIGNALGAYQFDQMMGGDKGAAKSTFATPTRQRYAAGGMY